MKITGKIEVEAVVYRHPFPPKDFDMLLLLEDVVLPHNFHFAFVEVFGLIIILINI